MVMRTAAQQQQNHPVYKDLDFWRHKRIHFPLPPSPFPGQWTKLPSPVSCERNQLPLPPITRNFLAWRRDLRVFAAVDAVIDPTARAENVVLFVLREKYIFLSEIVVSGDKKRWTLLHDLMHAYEDVVHNFDKFFLHGV